MSGWRTWSLRSWNERLLEHFFGRRGDAAFPVVVLLATTDELARATADPAADAGEVRSAFLAAVLCEIRGSLLAHATEYFGWPDPPRAQYPAPFVAHLVLTCIAASESSDELGDEASFVLRLRELTEGQLPETSLQLLPRLWEHLAIWLERNDDRFRPLILPDPGGLTRIGYTVKLAFPDRRDQRQLSEVLHEAGLLGHEPPIGKVLSLVAIGRARFRRSFLVAFEEFRRLFETALSLSSPELAAHRFWAAVRDAALRGRGADDLPGLRGRVQILCEEQDDQLTAFAASDEATVDAGMTVRAVELPVSYGQWRYALLVGSDTSIDAASLRATVEVLLARRLRVPHVSSLVEQGVLPFVEGPHGLLELAGRDTIDLASVVLARRELAGEVVALFGRSDSAVSASAYEGWVQIRGLRLRTLPSEQLASTALRRCWMLYESIAPTMIRLIGGIRADDGWLGFGEVLPRIATQEGAVVSLAGEERSEQLASEGRGAFKLPDRDLAGTFTILATREGITDRRSLRFYMTPATERYRMPSDRDAWIVEALGGTATLTATCPFAPSPGAVDAAEFAERVAYLGPIVGQFVSDPDAAAWRVTRFAGRTLGALCRRDLAAMQPTARVASASARSRWRRLLLNSTPDPSDPNFESARRSVRAQVVRILPTSDAPGNSVVLESRTCPRPLPAVDRLATVLAGSASSRAGLRWRDWSALVQRFLGVGPDRVDAVTRAWEEGGNIEVASYSRWWHRCVFARPPALVAYRVGSGVGATLMGLTLPTTRASLVRAAERSHLPFEERLSVSALVPACIVLRLPSHEHLMTFSRETGVPVLWLDTDLNDYGRACRHTGFETPPSNYETRRRWRSWSLRLDVPETVTLDHCMRADRPDYWIVTANERSVWSYDLNVARLWAATLAGEPSLSAVGETDIESHHAYLPLPLARAAAVLGAALPGPDADSGSAYRYVLTSGQLRDRVLNTMRSAFDPARVPLPAAPGSG